MNTHLWRELRSLDPMLREVFSYLVDVWMPDHLEVTSIYRTPSEDRKLKATGVHTTRPHRAMDIRTFDWSQAAHYARLVNARWEYDPERPKLLVAVSEPHGTGPHLHLQVHPRTRLR